MRICRYDDNRLGIVLGDEIADVTDVAEELPALHWPLPAGDHFIRHLSQFRSELEAKSRIARRVPTSAVTLRSPVANPGKIVAAPLNYISHVKEMQENAEIHHNTHERSFESAQAPVDKLGLFLKATSSVVGCGDGVVRCSPDRRTDHEVELALVVGREMRNVGEENALDSICGYCIGLDMTVRGSEDRSFRKSPDSYTVLGPWMVTSDEIADPSALDMWISINGETRQSTNTRDLTVGLARLVALASRWYTLYPGDVVLSGTPDGVGPVKSGDCMVSYIEEIGEMRTMVA